MLSFRTIVPDTLELLKRLTQEPFLKDCRLVGGTALALQYGHRSSVDLDFFGSFDAEKFEMPTMFVDFDWEQGKSFILNEVKAYESRY